MNDLSKQWQEYVRTSHSRCYDGIEICVYPSMGRNREEAIFTGLAAALRLIHDVQPWRTPMLRRHLARILCVYPLGAEYVPSIEACVIGYQVVEKGRIEQVAEAIVHELTHARIEHCGIEYTDTTRARIEHLCRKAELNFTRAVMSAPRLTRGEVPPLEPWWTEQHRVQRILDQLRELGLPQWLLSVAAVLYRVKSRIATGSTGLHNR